jgi:integrase
MTPAHAAAAARGRSMATQKRSSANQKRSSAKRKKCWSQSIGEYKLTVRVYELYPGSNLYRSVWVTSPGKKSGKEDKKSLGHKDRDRAVREAYELIAHLRSTSDGLRQGEITLGALKARYLAGRKHAAKAERTRKEDERKLERVVAFLGATKRASSLDEEAVLEYVEARRRGDPSLLYVARRESAGVRDGTVWADLVALHTMLHWGCVTKNKAGVTLLASDPLKGVEFPKELNPRKPIVTHDDVERLLQAADTIHPLLRPALIVGEGTGRRNGAWRQLRWRDIHFDREEFGAIHWPGETDKGKTALYRPFSPAVRDALLSIRPERPDPDWAVFPSSVDPRKPVNKKTMWDWMEKAFSAAGLPREPGGMWHMLRRKWVSERKGYPLVDIAAAGGWKDERSLKSYMQEDPETVRKVVLEPTHRLRRPQALARRANGRATPLGAGVDPGSQAREASPDEGADPA